MQTQENKQKLLQYIAEIGGNEVDWNIVTAQLRKLIKEYPTMEFKTIHYTLWFIHEHKNIEYNNAIFNLIPYYYQTAFRYNKELLEIQKSVDEFNWSKNASQTFVKNKKDDIIF